MDDHDRLVLDIADRYYLAPGSRERAFRDEANTSAVRGWQRVVQLLDDPQALVEEPEKVLRLRRLLTHRLQQRRAS
jgi:hypothetical protein